MSVNLEQIEELQASVDRIRSGHVGEERTERAELEVRRVLALERIAHALESITAFGLPKQPE